MSQLTLYRSSAGSGKTRTLAKVFIRLALSHRADYFRHILAITFTNKATQEMKSRIVRYLDEFARGTDNDLKQDLLQELHMDEATFRAQSLELLRLILHRYNDFSISTIDAFFQRVIRSFTREAGLAGDYRLIIETNEVLDEVVQNLLDEVGSDTQLTRWLIDFVTRKLEEKQKPDIGNDLKNFASLLLEEDFKRIEDQLSRLNTEQLNDTGKTLYSLRHTFIIKLSGIAGNIFSWIEANGLTANDFRGKSRGSVYSQVSKLRLFKKCSDFVNKGKGWFDSLDNPEKWAASDSPHAERIRQYAETQGIKAIREFTAYYEKHIQEALTAEIVLINFYLLGLTHHLLRHFNNYRHQHQAMLLADAPSFLKRIINESETPFIYEKVGSFYRHFLIDEFQDTSEMQWANIRPLVANALDQGYESMVVGDVKQAIYRWRGGNLNLLNHHIAEQFNNERIKTLPLNENYRSARQIVQFNNTFFGQACQLVKNYLGATLPEEVFRDVQQQPKKNEDGIVSVEFIATEKTRGNTWTDEAKARLCALIEELQISGVQPRDIAILVRKNEEGHEVINHLLNHQHSDKAKTNVNYQVISNESLRINSAASVNLLIYALRYLANPDDHLARAGLVFEYNRIHTGRPLAEVLQVKAISDFRNMLPDAFSRNESFLRGLPLYEMTETLAGIFNLAKLTGEIPYLQAFQDMVLNFSLREQNELREFLSWWEEARHTDRATIKSAAESNVMRLLTIHKAKGLQFPYVIIPFCSWGMGPHKETVIWVKTSQPPFNTLGMVPVKYSSNLENSYFCEDYLKERANSYVDNLNLLYVAFTRPEKGLYVLAPDEEIKSDTKISTVSKLLKKALFDNTRFNTTGNRYIEGKLSVSRHVTTEAPSHSLAVYTTFPWRNRLVIRTSAPPETEAQRKMGLRLHEVLARLHYADQLDELVNTMITTGSFNPNEATQLKQQIQSWLTQPVFQSWFNRSWTVRTEVPVLTPQGEYRRMDRLMTNGKHTVVVDFKSGTPAPADQDQVREYIGLLNQMQMPNVSGYLFYTRTGEIVEVTPQLSAKSKRGKNNNQLSFEF